MIDPMISLRYVDFSMGLICLEPVAFEWVANDASHP